MDPIFNLFKNCTKTIFLSSKHANLPLNMSTLMNCRNVKSVELLFCVSNYEGLLLWTTPKIIFSYGQRNYLIPQSTNQWPESKAKAEQINGCQKLSSVFLWSFIHSQFWDIFEEVKAVFGWPKFKNFFERDNHVNYAYLRTKIGCEMQFFRAIMAISFSVSKKAARWYSYNNYYYFHRLA